MKSVAIVLVLVLLLVGCQSVLRSPGRDAEPTLELVTEHVRIDDEVINKGDVYTILDPVFWTANIYDDVTEYNKSLAGFSREQRLLFAVIWYIEEVDNGGHDQFYSNSTGIVWKDALAGFRELEVDEAAGILEESAKRMGGDPSLDRETRWQQMDTHQPQFNDLDTKFFDLQAKTDLDAVMQDYIVKHRDAFYYEGDIKRPKLPDK